ncbi:MAG: hypothetical protein ABFR90_04720 [Planctomycetota bacterium]
MKFRSTIWGVILLQCAVYAQFSSNCPPFSDPNNYVDDPNALDNGLFECGDPNLTEFDFIPPIYWERIPHPESNNQDDCYAALHFNFQSEGARWGIMNPFEGDTFALLSTGGFGNINDNTIKGSKVSQEISLYSGDTILGAYFFGTNDYRPYNDFASIYLEPVDPSIEPNEPIILTYCDVDMVGSYQSTLMLESDGWIRFSHIIEPNQVGSYYLQCEVVDKTDLRINSYLAIDGLRICRGGKPISDLNDDCDVNLADYSILSEAWLSFCPDPPFYDPNLYDPNDYPPIADPNIPCQLADLDNSWFVDPNDLVIMSDEWLYTASDPNNL